MTTNRFGQPVESDTERQAASDRLDQLVEFGELTEDGGYTHTKSLPQSAMRACPHFIMVPEHYRDADNTCRCNDHDHTEMAEWGYEWADGQWQAGEDDEEGL